MFVKENPDRKKKKKMTLLKEMMSMANYELQEVMLSFQLANQTPVYLLSIH